jgi:hypothetical protein
MGDTVACSQTAGGWVLYAFDVFDASPTHKASLF